MSNLSNEKLKRRRDEIEKWRDIYEDGIDVGISIYSDVIAAIDELLAYREAAGNPVVIVEESDYLTVAQMTGKEPRRKAVRELYEGALIVGSKLYAAPQLSTTNQKPKSELLQRAERLAAETTELAYRISSAPVIPSNWVLVPIKPTEDMIIEGFESEPDETFSEEKVWEAYQAMSGCEQAAYRVRLCWAAMLAAAPKPNSET